MEATLHAKVPVRHAASGEPTSRLLSLFSCEQRRPHLERGYEFRVRGHVADRMRRAFPAFSAEIRGDDTLLRGGIASREALRDTLNRIDGLGLKLLDVDRLPPT